MEVERREEGAESKVAERDSLPGTAGYGIIPIGAPVDGGEKKKTNKQKTRSNRGDARYLRIYVSVSVLDCVPLCVYLPVSKVVEHRVR